MLRRDFYYKIYRKKGSIVLYTLVVGMICTSLAFSIFFLELKHRKSVNMLKEEFQKENELDKNREKLFCLFYENLKSCDIEMTKVSITDYVKTNYSYLSIKIENYELYFKEDSIGIIKAPFSNTNDLYECYRIDVEDGKLNFIKLREVFLRRGKKL